MTKQLKKEIQNYLNSFDDEELDYYELSELFYKANTLLVRAINE